MDAQITHLILTNDGAGGFAVELTVKMNDWVTDTYAVPPGVPLTQTRLTAFAAETLGVTAPEVRWHPACVIPVVAGRRVLLPGRQTVIEHPGKRRTPPRP